MSSGRRVRAASAGDPDDLQIAGGRPGSVPVLFISLISAGTEKIKPPDTLLGKLQFYH